MGCRVSRMRQEAVQRHPASIEAQHTQIQLAQELITQPPQR